MYNYGKKKPSKKKSMTKKPKSMKMSYGRKKKKQVRMDKLGVLCTQKEVLHGQRAQITLDLEVLLNNPTSIPEHTAFSI